MNLPVIFAPEISYRIEYIKSRNQFNTEGLSQWIDSLEWIVRFISNKSIAWDYAGQFKSDRYGNVYFNCFGYNLVFNLKEDEETTQLYVMIVEIDLNIEEFGLNENKQRNRTLIITEQQYNDLINRSFRTLLTEDQTASSIRDARNLLMKTYGWDKERADKFIRIDLRNDLPSLRSKQGRKIHSWRNENVYQQRIN